MASTDDGKAVTRYNRLTHGLRTAVIVLPDVEDEDEWFAFHDAVVANLAAVGPFESELASRAAELMWRLRRVARAERAWIDSYARDSDWEFGSTSTERILFARNRYIAPDEETAKLVRYEAHLGRQLQQVSRELRLAQDRRISAAAIDQSAISPNTENRKLPNELSSEALSSEPTLPGASLQLAPPARVGKLPNELPSTIRGASSVAAPARRDPAAEPFDPPSLLDST